mgnify:CR=1 FL=1
MRVVLCNCPAGDSERIARALIVGRFAACVNVIPTVQSYYLWDGALQCDAEHTLIIKVPEVKVTALRQRILDLHPYEVVEVLSLPVNIDESDGTYVDWVNRIVDSRKDSS